MKDVLLRAFYVYPEYSSGVGREREKNVSLFVGPVSCRVLCECSIFSVLVSGRVKIIHIENGREGL